MVWVTCYQTVQQVCTSTIRQRSSSTNQESNLSNLFSKFQYIEKKSGDKVDTVKEWKVSGYPQERELMKKVTLLQHFRNYLYNENKQDGDNGNFPPGYVYVKKWMKTKHAIMFRLSNKIVQVNFTDKSEIILSSEQKLVTYIDLKGQRSEYPLATALDSKNT